MSSKYLYIIGNGFDLCHNLPTGYSCFQKYVKENYEKQYHLFGKYFTPNEPDQLWSDFERNLNNFDVLTYVKDNIHSWKGMYFLDVDRCWETFELNLKDLFFQWVKNISFDSVNEHRYSFEDTNMSLFLTFNYTATLEKIYGIQTQDRVCHIHGATGVDNIEKPIVGCDGSTDWWTSEIKEQIEKLIGKSGIKECTWIDTIKYNVEALQGSLKKHHETEKIQDELGNIVNPCIRYNHCFFERIKKENITDIYVLGHSLDRVDKDYFVQINELIPHANWHLSCYYSSKNLPKQVEATRKQALKDLCPNIEDSQIDCFEM